MGDDRFNCVAILDAIPDGELNTAHHLHEDLQDIASYVAKGLEVRYFRIETPRNIEDAIASLAHEAEANGLKPWLHLEAHGAKDHSGFATADKSYCTWHNLKALVIPLNIATNLNVVIVLATCYGGSFTKAITTTDRAPVLAVIGPTRQISAGHVDTDFPSFYKTFFGTGSLKEAVAALTANVQASFYFRTTAEQFFYDVWANYKANHCSDTEIKLRARRLYRLLKRERSAQAPSIGQIKRLFRSNEERLFEKYRDSYFMYDLFPENRSRFPVTYKKAESYASRQ